MALSTGQKVGIGVGVVAVLGIGGYFLLKKKEEPGAASPTPAPLPATKENAATPKPNAGEHGQTPAIEEDPKKKEEPKPLLAWTGVLPKDGKWGIVGDDFARVVAGLMAFAFEGTPSQGILSASAQFVPANIDEAIPAVKVAEKHLAKITTDMKDVDVIVVLFGEETLRSLTSNVMNPDPMLVAMDKIRGAVQKICETLAAAYPNKKIVLVMPPWNGLAAGKTATPPNAEEVPSPSLTATGTNIVTLDLAAEFAANGTPAQWVVVPSYIPSNVKELGLAVGTDILALEKQPKAYLQVEGPLQVLAVVEQYSAEALATKLYGPLPAHA